MARTLMPSRGWPSNDGKKLASDACWKLFVGRDLRHRLAVRPGRAGGEGAADDLDVGRGQRAGGLDGDGAGAGGEAEDVRQRVGVGLRFVRRQEEVARDDR